MLATAPLCKRPPSQGDGRSGLQNLPDDVISTIVSKLGIRDFLRFRLTSKQWVHLPPCNPNINLDIAQVLGIPLETATVELHRAHKNSFVEAVNRFLDQVAPDFPLESFGLAFCLDRDSSHNIHRWIKFAISRRVKSLELKFMVASPHRRIICHVRLPTNMNTYIFHGGHLSSASRLETLTLHSCIFGQGWTTHCDTLKDLRLYKVWLKDPGVKSILLFCQNLTHLAFFQCDLPAKITIAGGGLKVLKVEFCSAVREIEVYEALSLTTFSYAGPRIQYKFTNVPLLTTLSLWARSSDLIDFMIEEVAHDFPTVKTISINWNCVLVTPLRGAKSPLNRLKHLELFCYSSKYISCETLVKILEGCPVLQKLCLVPPQTLDMVNERFLFGAHEHLKLIEVNGFSGNKDHVRLVRFLIHIAALDCLIVRRRANRYDSKTEYGDYVDWGAPQTPDIIANELAKLMKGGRFTFL